MKDLLGWLHRSGQCYSAGEQRVYDHDFRHLAQGLLVPLSARLVRPLRIAHYRPYTSKVASH